MVCAIVSVISYWTIFHLMKHLYWCLYGSFPSGNTEHLMLYKNWAFGVNKEGGMMENSRNHN